MFTALGLIGAAVAALLIFRIAQPYAFVGLKTNPQFMRDMEFARTLIAGQLDIPPMHQWTARADYWFPFINMVLWGLGPGLGLTGWLGFIVAGIEIVLARRWQHLLGFFWVGGLFLYLGQQVAKTDRYYLPLYPFLALFAAYLLVWLGKKAAGWWRVRPASPAIWLGRVLAPVVILAVVGYTLFWAAAFTIIYTRTITRIEASRWVFANVPKGAVLGNEHWDDPVPLRVDGKDPFGGMYRGVELQWYGEDTTEKRQQALQWLDQVEYIFLTSNRLYLSIPRLPLRYPMTTRYYEALFDGSLGFEPVATFTSRPKFLGIEIDDDDSEESFTVYDHPKVIIFQKTPAYSRAKVEALFGSVDLANIIRQKPLDYTLSRGGYQMTPELKAANYEGGTWSALFDPNDLVNRVPLLAWLVLLEALGLACFPLTFVAFRRFADRGYPLAKALAILALAWGAWTLASYRVLPFSRASIGLALLALVLVNVLIFLRRRRELTAFVRQHVSLLLIEELAFLGFFAILLLIRYGNPDLWHPAFGGEKPMDFAYLNAIIKSTWFPPYNPWFEGGYINYYYFGQVISATLVKFTGIVPEVAYNLLLPMFFGLTALGAFTVAFNVVAATRRSTVKPEHPERRSAGFSPSAVEGSGSDDPLRPPSTASCPEDRQDSAQDAFSEGLTSLRRPLAAGLLAASFVVLLGNLGEVRVLGNTLIKMGRGSDPLASLLAGASAWLLQGKPFPVALGDWFWHATRSIPDTINEFPFFTFLYGDLHAHLMGLAFTLTALAFAFHALLLRGRLRWFDLGIAALVLGALRPINTWDYPTYLAAVGAGLALGWAVEHRTPASVPDWPGRIAAYLTALVVIFTQIALLVVPANAVGIKVTLDVLIVGLVLAFGLLLGWTRAGAALDPRPLVRGIGWRMAALAGLSVLLYFPFLTSYGTAYSSVELWKGNRSGPRDFLIVHGIFLFIAATFLIVEHLRRRDIELWHALAGGVPLAALLAIGLASLKLPAVALVAPLALLAAWLLLRRDTPPERRFVALLLLAALLLIAMVEVITLKGDIGRMNTVFKFYLQAWVLFGVAGAAGLALVGDRLLPRRSLTPPSPAPAQGEANAPTRTGRGAWARWAWCAAMGLLLIAGLLYPGFATWAKLKDRYVPNSPRGLDGLTYMLGATYGENGQVVPLAPDRAAIQWLRENIEGSPVIAEANTGLYRWGNRISINTGLPTPIGWDWHTKQQYSLIEGGVMDRRLEDVRNLYNTADPNSGADDHQTLCHSLHLRGAVGTGSVQRQGAGEVRIAGRHGEVGEGVRRRWGADLLDAVNLALTPSLAESGCQRPLSWQDCLRPAQRERGPGGMRSASPGNHQQAFPQPDRHPRAGRQHLRQRGQAEKRPLHAHGEPAHVGHIPQAIPESVLHRETGLGRQAQPLGRRQHGDVRRVAPPHPGFAFPARAQAGGVGCAEKQQAARFEQPCALGQRSLRLGDVLEDMLRDNNPEISRGIVQAGCDVARDETAGRRVPGCFLARILRDVHPSRDEIALQHAQQVAHAVADLQQPAAAARGVTQHQPRIVARRPPVHRGRSEVIARPVVRLGVVAAVAPAHARCPAAPNNASYSATVRAMLNVSIISRVGLHVPLRRLQHLHNPLRQPLRVRHRHDLAHAGHAHRLAHAGQVGGDHRRAAHERLHLHQAERLSVVDRGHGDDVARREEVGHLRRSQGTQKGEIRLILLDERLQLIPDALAHHVEIRPGKEQVHIGDLGQDVRQRVDEVAGALLVGEARGKADDRPAVQPELVPQRRGPIPGRLRDDHRGQDHAQLGVVRKMRKDAGVLREVTRVGHNRVGQAASQDVVPMRHPIHQPAIPDARRHLQIAVIRQARLPAGQPGQRSRQGRFHLGQVDADHIVRLDFAPGQRDEGRHEDALIQPEEHRHAHHPHAVQHLLVGQLSGIVRGEHRHLVAALRQRPRQPLHVDRQAAHVGPIVSQRKENLHPNSSRFAPTHSISRLMPWRTLTCGAQPNSRVALLTSATKTG